jgi:undecaprenyl-diphosphatase
MAVVVLYWKKFFDFKKFNFYIKLIIAVLACINCGFFLKKHIDAALGNLSFIACVMVAGGVILLFIDKVFKNPVVDSEEKVTNKTAFIIGCGQVLSIVFPGLSRSAATIITGMSQKLTRSAAAEFSFFLAVPTMFAASAKSFLDTYTDHPEVLEKSNLISLLLGSAVAFVVSVIAIKFFIDFLKKYGFVFGEFTASLQALLCFLLIWRGIIVN